MITDLDLKAAHGSVQALVTLKTQQKCRRSADDEEDENDEEVFDEQKYVDALCTGSQGDINSCRDRQTDDVRFNRVSDVSLVVYSSDESSVTAGGASVFSFQTIKRGNKMAQIGEETLISCYTHCVSVCTRTKVHFTEIDRYIDLPIFPPIFKEFTIIGYRFCKKKMFCHIHNCTEYKQQ